MIYSLVHVEEKMLDSETVFYHEVKALNNPVTPSSVQELFVVYSASRFEIGS